MEARSTASALEFLESMPWISVVSDSGFWRSGAYVGMKIWSSLCNVQVSTSQNLEGGRRCGRTMSSLDWYVGSQSVSQSVPLNRVFGFPI